MPEETDLQKPKRPASSLFLVKNTEAEKEPVELGTKKGKLLEEVESWEAFTHSLRLQDRQVLKQLLENIWAFDDMVEKCKEGYDTEAFLLSLLILQQKTIDQLESLVERKKVGE